jgi:hypothetical protein
MSDADDRPRVLSARSAAMLFATGIVVMQIGLQFSWPILATIGGGTSFSGGFGYLVRQKRSNEDSSFASRIGNLPELESLMDSPWVALILSGFLSLLLIATSLYAFNLLLRGFLF